MSLSKLQQARGACWARRDQEPNKMIIQILPHEKLIHTFISNGDLDNSCINQHRTDAIRICADARPRASAPDYELVPFRPSVGSDLIVLCHPT